MDWTHPDKARRNNKKALDWNLQGSRRKSKEDLKKTVQEESLKVGKTWSEAKKITIDREGWKRCIDVLCSKWER